MSERISRNNISPIDKIVTCGSIIHLLSQIFITSWFSPSDRFRFLWIEMDNFVFILSITMKWFLIQQSILKISNCLVFVLWHFLFLITSLFFVLLIVLSSIFSSLSARQRMQHFLSNYKHDQMSNNEKNTNNNFTSHNFTFTPFKLFMDQTSGLYFSWRILFLLSKHKITIVELIEPQDTWLFPTIQIGPVGIDHDSKVTSYILQNAPPESTLHITSPYFNFSENYSDLILNGSSFVDVIVASPQVCFSFIWSRFCLFLWSVLWTEKFLF